MTQRILLTALAFGARHAGLSYYCAKDLDEKTLYCDAVLPTEAGAQLQRRILPDGLRWTPMTRALSGRTRSARTGRRC